MLFWYELKKLITAPAIIGFVLLCIIVNAVIVFASYNDYYLADIQADTTGMTDIFDGFDAVEIVVGRYSARHGLSGEYEQNVREKYEKLQPVIEAKAANDESLSPYFGDRTPYLHKLLFQTLFGAIIAESCLIALFVALISTGYESARNTEGVVYGSKSGRDILRTKFFASLTAGGAFFVVIIGVSLMLFFSRFDWTNVWNDNVSSLFNRAVDEYAKPFITWHSFSVLGLIWASVGISAGVVLCFNLLGYAVGTFVRNGYGAVLTAVATVGVIYVAEPLFPYGSSLRSALNLTPVGLWCNVGEWFTDGYADILWANFECIGVGASIAALTAMSGLAVAYFKRRDLV